MAEKVQATFFSKPTRWNGGARRGFIVRPTDGTSGWGEPFEDEETGDPIVPGTPDGPYDRAYLGIKDSTWRVIRKRNWQEAGNIDWKGNWTSKAKTKRRIVTWHGPQQRYWNSGTFKYGDVQEHRFIYSNGTIIGIAPSPVLAACVRSHDELQLDGVTRVRVTYVVAICREGVKDVVYITQQYLQFLREGITDEILDEHGTANYQGSQDPAVTWLGIGEGEGYSGSAATVSPEAPWFFDMEGEYARTMRRATYVNSEFDPDDPDYVDTLYRELRVRVNLEDKEAVFTQAEDLNDSLYNSRWNTTLRGTRDGGDVRGIYTQPATGPEADPDGEPHQFREDFATTSFSMYGSSKVCVDYDADNGRWLYGWMRGSFYRYASEYWTIGFDDGVTYGETNPNTGSLQGPKPWPQDQQDYLPSENNHYRSSWFGCSEEVGFHITEASGWLALDTTPSIHQVTLQWGKSGDASVQAGGENDPDNPYLAFWDSYTTYIQFMDIRSGLMIGYIYMNLYEVSTQTVITEEVQWTGVSSDPMDLPQIEGDSTDSYFFMRHAPRPPTIGGWPTDWSSDFVYLEPPDGWNQTETGEYPVPSDAEESYFTYSGTYTTANTDPDTAIFKPNWQSAYTPFYQASAPKPRWEKVSLVEALYTPALCDITGVYGSTELNEHLVYLEYFDKVEKDFVSKSYSWGVEGDPLEETKGGTKMAPGGLI